MKQELKDLINNDLWRYGYKTEKEIGFWQLLELYGYRYTKIMRKTKFYKERHNIIRYAWNRIRLSHMTIKYGFSIPYSLNVGCGLYLGHFGNIVVNCKAVIGNNVNLSQGVTIGLANGGKKPGVPTIGNNVWIGANATVVGGINVGNDVMIAPNTFVNFDVPDHSVVVSQKAGIHYKENATKDYVEHLV